MFSLARLLAGCVLVVGLLRPAGADDAPAEFFRAINLNGPAIVIDGRNWDGHDSVNYSCDDRAFENQNVPLRPPTDPSRTLMIRSSRWHTDFRLEVREIPKGTYTVFIYVWEDNNSETFTVALDGREVEKVTSGEAGTWQKLGPWSTTVTNGRIVLAARGGAANVSGIEIWRGRVSAADTLPKPAPPRDPAVVQRFDRDIAPILSRHCLECHGGSEREGGLVLSSEETAFQGGESGPAIVPEKPDASPLWQYVEIDEMPRDRPALTATEKQRLRQWIADGAKWGTPDIDPFLTTTDRRAGYDWWSLQPIRKPPLPSVRDTRWTQNEIDNFILAKLEATDLRPAAEADRRTLIRRVTFDLTGLPPEPEEVERFVNDPAPDAYERLVDRLLDSPHYGERWGRHWLDVVRFGESQGFERNRIRENAWRYRDWVIQAFNRDLPFDEFIRLQIAGDVLKPDDLQAWLATGYHVCGTWDQVAHLEGSALMQQAARHDAIEDLVATLGQAFLGLTINCARCHDHKFDPISQREYYQTAALLSGVHQQEKERDNLKISIGSQHASPATHNFQGIAHIPVLKQPPPTFVLARGDFRRPTEAVAPAGLKALRGLSSDFGLTPNAPEAQRRLKLAEWLSDERNPLTPRVFVNRLWHYHFGKGLVDTPSDFGFNGGRPSHPELLDYLAARFIAGDWKVKELHRLLVNSATYRQRSRVANESATAVDADNRLLWRANRRRLEGEAVRDSALMISGALNRTIGGPSFRDVEVKLGRNHEFTDPTGEFSEATCRRSIYRLWARSGNLPMLEALDCPDPSVMAPQRTKTITPVQALALFNNNFMEQCAARFAMRLAAATDDGNEQVELAYRLAFSRTPTDQEASLARAFIAEHGLDQFALVLFNTNEFLFVD